jgi:hypothetical protein
MIGPRLVPISDAATKLAYKTATARNDGICELCRRQPGQRHHRQGRDPYNTVPSNLLLACLRCHSLIHSKPAWARERGYIVPSWSVPAEYPLMYTRRVNGLWREIWVLLNDHGGMREIPLFEADRRIDGDWHGVP